MTPTFPENRRTAIRAKTLLLILLASVASLGASLGVSGVGSREDTRPAESESGSPFDPFTRHDALPSGLTWIVQLERPAEQLESEQGRSLAAAIDQTDLITQTRKAWSRLSRTLGGEKEAYALLGRRAMFIAGTSAAGSPWAVCVEIAPEQRQSLLARLNAFPRLSRNKRPISELEDGRYLLAVFDQGTRAVVLLGPRSDRAIRPEADPETALFYEMFDRLSGLPARDRADGPLPAALAAVGQGEILIARQGTDLLWDAPNQTVSIRDEPDEPDGPDEPDAPTREGEPGFMAIRLDRSAGGWTGQAVLSDEAANNPAPPNPAPPGEGPPAGLDYARLERAAPTISWLTLSPDAREALRLVTLRLLSVAVSLPDDPSATSYVALLNPDRHNPDAKPALAIVTRVDPDEGPAAMDRAMARTLAGVGPGGPDHAGRYPGAVRVQRFTTLSPLGPEAEAAWGYSGQAGGVRTAAVVFAHAGEGADRDSRDSSASALVSGLLAASARGEPSPVAAGRLRPADLQRLMRRLVPSERPAEPLLTRLDSVTWTLERCEINGRRACQGPFTVLLTPSRPGELGTE